MAAPDASSLPFSCSVCEFATTYSYKGPQPPGSNVTFLEEAYVRRDPFSERPRPLLLGSDCALCSRPVCAAAGCSLFYCRRFCLSCVAARRAAFPPEVLREFDRAAAGGGHKPAGT